jgi:tetratricopeptide (TPR) repeat protein
MGVRYVLEGSVQKANQRIRIAVQLIDATTGYHVWSEQYDRPLTDIFAVQDDIVQRIVTTLQLQLTLQEQGIIIRKHTNNLEAYDAFLRGQAYYARATQEGNVQARQLFEKAVTLDPQYAEAYASLGLTYLAEWLFRWGPFQVLEQARALEQRALALDDSLPFAHSFLGTVYAEYHQYEQAIAEGEHSITLAPNEAHLYANLAGILNLAGRHEDARRAVQQAIRLNPHVTPGTLFQLGWSDLLTGRYAEAITILREVHSRDATFPFVHTFLAASYLLQWLVQLSPADQTLELALTAVQQGISLNDSNPGGHIVSGYIALYQHRYDQALGEMERAVSLGPNEAGSYAALAVVLSNMGKTEEALQAAAHALQLKPLPPDIHLADVGTAYAMAGHYEEARAPLQRFLSRFPNNLIVHLTLAAVYSELGQDAEAQKEVAEVLRLNPNFSLEVFKQRSPVKDPAVLERGIAALRKAGLK